MHMPRWYLCSLLFCLALSGCPGNGSNATSQADTADATALSPQEQTAYFTSQFTLRNTGDVTAAFALKVNNSGPYENLADLKEAVLDYPDDYPGEPLYRKAWRFVRDNNTHFIPLYGNSSQDQALLYINSPGFGFCSDVATALDQVWSLLGYQSRIWYLNGHVVPSVYADGAWHMLDPDLRVYYLDSRGSIASVPELESDPSLITSPVQMLDGANSSAYSENVRNIYASSNDNSVYPLSAPAQDFVLTWVLPPGASLTMPILATKLDTTQGVFDNTKADAHIALLDIPAGWKGEVDIPLLVYDITGKGAVSVLDSNGSTNTFTIGSDALEQYINARMAEIGASYFYRLNIDATDTVSISYFINTKTMELGEENQLGIKGNNLDDITIN
jgi:hypothetical protein